MFVNILLLIVYVALLKKFKKSFHLYEAIVNNRTEKTDYFLDYCDEPICFK